METLKIGGKDYGFKLTLESWKRLKERGITPQNMEEKIKEDMAGVVSDILYFGLSVSDRSQVKQDDIDALVDLSIAKDITEAVQRSIPTGKDDEEKK